MNGLPLLSHSPPDNSDGSDEATCRKCSKEFNFLFTRLKRCNHCGYAYCSSCADFQALMPRSGPDTGYEVNPVCAYCIDMLSITASNKNKLRSLPLATLRAYMKAYNIVTSSSALEKDDLVDAVILARGPNGCLLPAHEAFYRNNSVPKKTGERQRTRSFFSRPPRPPTAPPPPPPSRRQHAPQPAPPSSHARTAQARPAHPQPGASPPPQMPRPQPQPYRHDRPPAQMPHHYHNSPPPRHPSQPQPTTQPPMTNMRASASQTNFHAHPPSSYPGTTSQQRPQPPSRPRSAAPTVPTPPVIPSLDSLLEKSSDEISHYPISTLKAILFENRVNSSMGVLEKQDLVHKVLALVKDERRDREIAEREEREEAERMEWARREREKQERDRQAEERDRRLAEERLRRERENKPDGEPERSATDEFSPNSAGPNASYSEKSGLCVVCCDAHANMAIIDCGHLALCKGCSEIVMKTTRECPLCRTRIVTEQRLLRIFKS